MKALILFILLCLSEKNPPSIKSIAVDSNATEETFLMPVEDVFNISGRGTIAIGIIERGKIKTGDSVEIVGLSDKILKSKINLIEAAGQIKQEAKKGDNIGLLLSGIEKTAIKRGMVICQPRSLTAYSEFSCKLQLKSKEDGGRTTPIFNKYRPQFRFRNVDISGEIILSADKQELKPGESATVTVALTIPAAMEKNNEIIIREGGRDIGSARIIDILK